MWPEQKGEASTKAWSLLAARLSTIPGRLAFMPTVDLWACCILNSPGPEGSVLKNLKGTDQKKKKKRKKEKQKRKLPVDLNINIFHADGSPLGTALSSGHPCQCVESRWVVVPGQRAVGATGIW